jgi:hypothetical protein
MNRPFSFALMCAAVMSMTWLEACGKHQTPTSPTTGAPAVGLSIIAPPGLGSPGQAAQLTAQAIFGDGTKSDVTASALWQSSNPNVAAITTSGFVRLVGSGVAIITARLPSGPTGTLSLAVNPMVGGRITEAGEFPLAQVQVTIIGGPQDGQVTTTDQYGQYSVGGAAGAQQVRAAKDGYVTVTVNVGSNPTRVDIVMSPSTPYADLHGSWKVTFSTSPSCQLPQDVMTRTYTAAVQQNNARLTINFSGATFDPGPPVENWMFGRVYGNTVNVDVGSVDDSCFYYHQCFAELLADGRRFTLSGTAAGSTDGSALSLLFAGAVTLAPPNVTCTAADHHLSFTR